MDKALSILAAELDHDDGVIVKFSDGTEGAYVAEELLELRPKRELSSATGLRVRVGDFLTVR